MLTLGMFVSLFSFQNTQFFIAFFYRNRKINLSLNDKSQRTEDANKLPLDFQKTEALVTFEK